MATWMFILPIILSSVSSFSCTTPISKRVYQVVRQAHEKNDIAIDRQSDEKYGRGISHISADISEGEIVAYQVGTWYVDGNDVGDGSDPIIRYMLVDTIQIVWTHNCEHGVINGFDITINTNEHKHESSTYNETNGAVVNVGSTFVIGNEYVQCGPEQVVAKIPITRDSDKNEFVSLVQFLPNKEILTG